MEEMFYEESAIGRNKKAEKTKYVAVIILAIISFVLAFLNAYYIVYFVNIKNVNVFLTILIHFIPGIILIAIGILLLKLKNRFLVDYDYTFISGSIRISKVVNNNNRYRIFKFDISNILKIGEYDSDYFKKVSNEPDTKPLILTSNNTPEDDKSFYYIHLIKDSKKHLLVLECSKQFVINVLRYSKRTIRDDQLKWFI